MKKLLLLPFIFTACGTYDASIPNRLISPHKPMPSPSPVAPLSCTVKQLAQGAQIMCPDGSVALITDGTNGINGTDGINGTNGTDATPVTTVQFCPGTPTYPSTFPEFGIIISGVMYGVYSQNGGFLAQLPPGKYYSNGIGSTCNFTINPDLTITQD
jgi:hypothetical protein